MGTGPSIASTIRDMHFEHLEAAALSRGRQRPPAKSSIAHPDRTRLREHDLDSAVLRLAYAWGRRYAQIIHAATADNHVAARHAEPFERGGDRVGTPLGQPLVVAGRPRGVGEAGNRELHTASRLVVIGCERDDPLAFRRDVVLIPVEEHEEDL